ncbi:hypothetical protein JXA88_16220 [Candidatus Fermentibacteria bacterium]|nr:hypothetical protein [Candidatus Fermentibacteria bacterium]
MMSSSELSTRDTTQTPMFPVFIATFTEHRAGLDHIRLMVESLRAFGGKLHQAPVRVYLPPTLIPLDGKAEKSFRELSVDFRVSQAPDDALRFPFSRKVFAAAQAEGEAEGHATTLVYLDEDTIILDEPTGFELTSGTLAYRPVMHQNIGSVYDAPLDEFWERVYEKLEVPPRAVFPMPTVADGKVLRPYFNAGLLVVNPEAGLLRQWAKDFPVLYRDSVFVDWCRADKFKAIFLHQAALSATILCTVSRDSMTLLPDGYNYPVFFDEMFVANRPFDSLEGVITTRHEGYFQNPAPDWSERLKGPPDRIAWLKAHLGTP